MVVKDLICGMDVREDGAKYFFVHQDQKYYFCSAHCKNKFAQDPQKYLQGPPVPEATASEWTCPMHPEILQPRPGSCPKCGMALEALTPSEKDESVVHSGLVRKFWVSLFFALAVFILAMSDMHSIPFTAGLNSKLKMWLQLIFSAPVVFWGGSLFLRAPGPRLKTKLPICLRWLRWARAPHIFTARWLWFCPIYFRMEQRIYILKRPP